VLRQKLHLKLNPPSSLVFWRTCWLILSQRGIQQLQAHFSHKKLTRFHA